MSADLKIELWPINDLKPYEGNAKIHDHTQIETLARLIDVHGWTQPIVVDRDGVIIAGHGRRLAAIHLGRKTVPVVVRRDLTKDQADALRLADNRISSQLYDTDMIQKELARLAETDMDLSNLGFDEKELEFLTSDLGEINVDSMVDDINEAVETQKSENAQKVQELDEKVAPLADAFGFRHANVAQTRRIRQFMIKIENETGKRGIEALMVFLDNHGID